MNIIFTILLVILAYTALWFNLSNIFKYFGKEDHRSLGCDVAGSILMIIVLLSIFF